MALSNATMSGGSTLAAWCLAARPLVLGSRMRSSANLVPGAESVGRIKSSLVASKLSPIRRSPDQVRLKIQASIGQPHSKATDRAAKRIDSGKAG